MPMNTYKFPRKHAADWIDRCNNDDWNASILKQTERTITLSLCTASLADLIDDAHYYQSEMHGEYTDGINYSRAATTLLNNMRKQGIISA